MSDDLLKDVLRKAARTEPSVGDAFVRFEKEQRRAALARFFTVVTIALAAAILLTRLLPGASSGVNPDVIIPGGQDVSRPEESNRYIDPVAGFRVNYSIDWIGNGEAGSAAEFFPRVGLNQGERTTFIEKRKACEPACDPFGTRFVLEQPAQFFMEVVPVRSGCLDKIPACLRVSHADPLDTELRQAGAAVNRINDVIAKRKSVRTESSFPRDAEQIRRPGSVLPPHYWCSGCRMTEWVIPWTNGYTLYIRAVTGDRDDFKRNNALIGFVLDTLTVVPR